MILSPGDVLEIGRAFTPQNGGGGESDGAAAEALEEVEQRHILKVLEATQWHINGPGNAAERLRINPNTLRSRLQKLGIRRPVRGSGAPGR